MSSTPTYDLLQQVFSLNWLANIEGFKFGTQEQLQAEATKAINGTLSDPEVIGLIGNYQVVWGPVVYQVGAGTKSVSQVVDNLMYVAKTTTAAGTRYVVAIAATNPVSLYGWVVEDFWVSKTVPWPGAPGAVISAGANTGLGILLGLQSGGQTLLRFLQQAVTGAGAGVVDVVVSGHSLGGTLSPLLALTLAEQQGQSSGWDPERRAVVSAVASAGFSPGNQPFADYLEAVLGLRTTRIWSRLDMVSAAWVTDTLQHAPFLFYPFIVPNALVQATATFLILLAKSSGQTYVQYNRQTAPLDAPVDLSLASMELKLPPGVRRQFAQRVARAATAAWNLSLESVSALQSAVETVLDEVAAEVDKGSGAVTPQSALKAIQVASAKTRQRVEAAANLIQIPGVSDLAAEIEGLLVFYAQALIQHVMPYLQILGVTKFVEVMTKYAAGSKPSVGSSQPKILELPGANVSTLQKN